MISIEPQKRSICVDHGDVLPAVPVVVKEGKGAAVRRIIESGDPGDIDELRSPSTQKEVISFVPAVRDPGLLLGGKQNPERFGICDSQISIAAYDRTPEEASYVHLALNSLWRSIKSAQSVDIQPTIVVEIGELAAPGPTSFFNQESGCVTAGYSFKCLPGIA